MSSLRETVKTLYSFENPFSNKLASSTNEDAVTVEASREADFATHKIEVILNALSDKFLSDNIERNLFVEQGQYTFTIGEKTVDFRWRGGKVQDFISALNKRSNGLLKANVINISSTKSSFMIESLKPGLENKLSFSNDAYTFAEKIGLISKQTEQANPIELQKTFVNYKNLNAQNTAAEKENAELANKSPLSTENTSYDKEKISVKPRGAFAIKFSDEVKNNPSSVFEFTFKGEEIEDITKKLNDEALRPQINSSGGISFKGINVFNNLSETTLPKLSDEEKITYNPITLKDEDLFFVKQADGKEIKLDSSSFSKNPETNENTVKIKLSDFENPEMLIVKNSSTGKEYSLSIPQTYDSSKVTGFKPNHAITEACDAKIKYEGITLIRGTNDIDDVIPHLTLHIKDKTEKPVEIKIKPDTESAKYAIITFVGKYNQTIAELTILTTNKPEVISELDYLTDSEVEKYNERLGMFQGDFALTNGKSTMQRICSGIYRASEYNEISMLSQLGISTNASKGTAGYNAAQLRGYLEADEKKLDFVLENNLNEVKDLFGYDSDGDLIIDSGIAYALDNQLTSWTRSGGIISSRTNSLESNIKATNQKIAKLQVQIDAKEAELKRKYANMEGTLNSLESQQNSINNFANQNNKNK